MAAASGLRQLLLVLVAAACLYMNAPAVQAQRGTCGIAVCFVIDGERLSGRLLAYLLLCMQLWRIKHYWLH